MFKSKLCELRKERGMSLCDLSKVTGLSYSVLYDMEKKNRNVTISTAIKVANVLECKLDDLFDYHRSE